VPAWVGDDQDLRLKSGWLPISYRDEEELTAMYAENDGERYEEEEEDDGLYCRCGWGDHFSGEPMCPACGGAIV
jgi:hypothetical protein